MTERTITLGIMKLAVAGKESDGTLDTVTEAATVKFNQVIEHKLDIQIESFSFTGRSLTPDNNGYRAFSFQLISTRRGQMKPKTLRANG
ncbi:hypothetical protein [Psychrobacter sp. DM4]|uniref:hypothetical protein n=1 Tax=Psychrobacter sp. DM4 TaxID=3440637 RepID=UPI003F4F77C4